MALGGYFIGANFFGITIDPVLWQQIAGIGFAVIALAWSVFTKSLKEEVWRGLVRQVVTFAGGVLLARGIITNEMWQSIFAFIAALFPFILSAQTKDVAGKLKSGKISPTDLSS